MPVLTGPLSAEGAVVDARIGWSDSAAQAQRAALRPVPPPVDVRALIDSGAEVSCADPSVIQALGLPVGGFVLANVPAQGGLTYATQHDAGLVLIHPSGDMRLNLVIRTLLVVELPIGVLGYQTLLGRDVLTGCRFLYDGPAAKFELHY
jgi:hypothetical protein